MPVGVAVHKIPVTDPTLILLSTTSIVKLLAAINRKAGHCKSRLNNWRRIYCRIICNRGIRPGFGSRCFLLDLVDAGQAAEHFHRDIQTCGLFLQFLQTFLAFGQRAIFIPLLAEPALGLR